MSEDLQSLQNKLDVLQQEIAVLNHRNIRGGVRKRSTTFFFGLPLYDIAYGPDLDSNSKRGHARGIIAIGDIATGVIAVGGIARGFVAIGGIALGAVSVGGCSIAILLGIGGFAVGMIAVGGAAIGIIATGGGAFGYYACGGGAIGKHTISGMGLDPDAIRFFRQWIPAVDQLVRSPDR